MLVLGIETSCDETGIGVVKDGREVLSNAVVSSLEFHKRYGGVIPEIATRYHLEVINYALKDSLASSGKTLKDIDLAAVTYGPGLIGSLLVGISFAKSLSYSLDIPLVGVNHLWAHIYSGLISRPKIKFPLMGLVVSGGHTSLVLCEDIGRFRLLGQTKDDAIGEAFDKVAKILGLGFPGGPAIERAARNGNPDAIRFALAYLGDGSYDFSFSGIKTAVLYCARDKKFSGPLNRQRIADIAASFQKAAIGAVVERSISACRAKGVDCMIVGGGVSANKLLRNELTETGLKNGIEVIFPPMEFSLDNGAMIASAGYLLFKKGKTSDMSLTAEANLGI